MDLLSILFAQLQSGQMPDFGSTPPPTESVGSWWPLITTCLSLIVAAIAALFTAWQKMREKKLENTASAEQSRLQLEIEELKHQFESRKQLHDQLTSQITNLLAESRLLREELASARLESSEKAQLIAELIAELRAKESTLNTKLSFLEAELKRYKNEPVDDVPPGISGDPPPE
jgi:septal ring factor EnvC (AmiA/AmiB activator)